MFKFFLLLVILFLIIRFILRFLLPILKVTRMTQQHMSEMKKKMDTMQQSASNNAASSKTKQKLDGDYIEYEEVK